MLRRQGGGGDGGHRLYRYHPLFYPLLQCVMIAVNIIGHNCHSIFALVGLGIRKAQVESVVNGIGLITNGLGPYKGRMTIPPIPVSSATSTFIPSSPNPCRLILLPTEDFVVIVVLLGFPVNFSGDQILSNINHWKLSTAHMPGTLKGW